MSQKAVLSHHFPWLVFFLLTIVTVFFVHILVISHTIPKNVLPSLAAKTQAAPPHVAAKAQYTIFLVGDSMTFALGPHAPVLNRVLRSGEPRKSFVIDNYSEGAKNILSLPDMLNRGWTIGGQGVSPALARDFDILVIESYGHNPMSPTPISTGQNEQWATLNSVLSNIRATHPNSIVIFLATIAPSEKDYAKGVLNLTPATRVQFAQERRSYIESFIGYARSHGIPLVDVYHRSMTANGKLKTQFVNTNDYIHPSGYGSYVIQQMLGNFILARHYLPS